MAIGVSASGVKFGQSSQFYSTETLQVSLADGNTMVWWKELEGNLEAPVVHRFYQIFDSAGSAVSTPTAFDQGAFQDFAWSYTAELSDGTRYLYFTGSLGMSVSHTRVSISPTGEISAVEPVGSIPQVLHDGSELLMTANEATDTYSLSLTSRTGETLFSGVTMPFAVSNSFELTQTIVELPNGNLMLLYQVPDAYHINFQSGVRFFDRQGNMLSDTLAPEPTQNPVTTRSNYFALSNKIVWVQGPDSAAILKQDGSLLSQVVFDTDFPDGASVMRSVPTVCVTDGIRVFAVQQQIRLQADDSYYLDIFVRAYDGLGREIGQTQRVSHTLISREIFDVYPAYTTPSASLSPDGILRIVANDVQSGAYQNELSLLDTRHFFGSASADTWVGSRASDDIYGRSGNDNLNGSAGADNILGGNGNDVLRGGTGQDAISGGNGKDVFDFNAINETGTSATTCDKISDFALGDRLDLSGIDASLKTGGNNKFTFIGANGFHHVAGELRFKKIDLAGTSHDKTMIYGDVTGDGEADLQLALTGLKILHETDFVL